MNTKQPSFKKIGRPKSDSPVIKKSVSLLPDTYKHLMQVGGNELSKGVRLVAEFHQEALKAKS
jgi:hypothetical protein